MINLTNTLGKINDEILVVYFSILSWEDSFGYDYFTHFKTDRDALFMLVRVSKAIRKNSPPDINENLDDWIEFVLNEFIEFSDDFDINDIKDNITIADRLHIVEQSKFQLSLPREEWHISELKPISTSINNILDKE